MTFEELCEELEAKIIQSYTEGVTLEEAEKLAGQFLHGMLAVSNELKKIDLDSRMKKSGVKAVRAAIYTESAKPNNEGKKPTEAALAALVDMNELVTGEQQSYDQAEVEKDNLERYYNTFREGHIYFRGIAKGKFE